MVDDDSTMIEEDLQINIHTEKLEKKTISYYSGRQS